MDIDAVAYRGPIGKGVISVEVSYREGVVLDPDLVAIDTPYYEPFAIPAMRLEEIVSEKIRTLAQRDRPSDLADLAMILTSHEINQAMVRSLTNEKFKLVKQGDHVARITENVESMSKTYDAAVRALAPDAPAYDGAREAVLSRLDKLLG